MRFCCKTENFTKSAQFWSQNVPLGLTKKIVPTLYVLSGYTDLLLQCSPFIMHLFITWIWIQHGRVMAPKIFTMEFYKGITGK